MNISYLVCSFPWICAQLFLFHCQFPIDIDIITHSLERATEYKSETGVGFGAQTAVSDRILEFW